MHSPATSTFFNALFGHDSLSELLIGTSQFPPGNGIHAWHPSTSAAASWVQQRGSACNVYFRTTPVAVMPESGRGASGAAAALVGVHADLDIAHPVHAKAERLPPDLESARRIIKLIGLHPSVVVDSGHGLQAYWLFKEPWLFRDSDADRAGAFARRFGETVRACAGSLGFTADSVFDLARILRVPGTMNVKSDPVPVALLEADGPRYLREDIESILVDIVSQSPEPASRSLCVNGKVPSPPGPVGFEGTDEELLQAARQSRDGRMFTALYDRGDVSVLGSDHSRADWHCVSKLAFWGGPDPARIDRLFRGSKLFREKWDQRHSADGRTYGEMTIGDVISTRETFFRPRPKLPVIVVSARHLRDITHDSIKAIDLANRPPFLFQQGTGLVRVRADATTQSSLIEPLGVDALVGVLTRSADFLKAGEPDGKLSPTSPPTKVAKDILSLPLWRFPNIVGIAESPRVRADGSILVKPGYDPDTRLFLTRYEGWETFDVPEDPSVEDARAAVALIDELLIDFPFVSKADKANAIAFMLTPVLRAAIKGNVPIAAFDAKSKQGTGKGLLVKVCTIVSCGREPAMTAIPDDEAEWRKSLTSTLMTGCEVIIYDNAVSSVIESGVWANCVTADFFDDRILGISKRARPVVRCTWAITGNAMAFGKDLVRRIYSIVQDARVERPEDRTGFMHELPAWAIENRLRLLRAVLILARAWWVAGCPTPRVSPLGSFEEWTRIVGGILEHAGIPGFLGNRDTFRKRADTDRSEWCAFISALESAGGSEPFTTAQAAKWIEGSEDLKEALPSNLRDALDKQRSFATKLGIALSKASGAVFGSFKLDDAPEDTHSKKPRYQILPSNAAAQPAESPGTQPK